MPSLVLNYPRNTRGRDFAVGDIHGHFTRLEAAMRQVDFDPAVDRMFSVGDMVDRGPESERVLEYIKKPWFHAVRGNHEDMAIRYPEGHMRREHYVRSGGAWMVGSPRSVQLEVSDALSTLPVAITVETDVGDIGIVHADCPTERWRDFTGTLTHPSLADRERELLTQRALWSRERIDSGDCTTVQDVAAVIVGHTPLGQISRLGNVYYIDTGACFEHMNKLTLVQLAPAACTIIREAAVA
jgi:serine/threonine protein phosphatase 1